MPKDELRNRIRQLEATLMRAARSLLDAGDLKASAEANQMAFYDADGGKAP